MSFADDDRPRKQPLHEIGADLSMLSADDLKERITLLAEEIKRLEVEVEKKGSGRAAAEKFFR